MGASSPPSASLLGPLQHAVLFVRPYNPILFLPLLSTFYVPLVFTSLMMSPHIVDWAGGAESVGDGACRGRGAKFLGSETAVPWPTKQRAATRGAHMVMRCAKRMNEGRSKRVNVNARLLTLKGRIMDDGALSSTCISLAPCCSPPPWRPGSDP